MATKAEEALEVFNASIGVEDDPGEWFAVTQEQVNQFADCTIDHQFIHVDPEAAKATPFGGPIAHGFLTLSMLTHLDSSTPKNPAAYAGVVMGVNYGFEKVRFVSPVPVGSRIRAKGKVAAVDLKDPNTIQVTRTITVEVEGNDRPACVADWITRIMYG